MREDSSYIFRETKEKPATLEFYRIKIPFNKKGKKTGFSDIQNRDNSSPAQQHCKIFKNCHMEGKQYKMQIRIYTMQ
jgi:hypothetical protein